MARCECKTPVTGVLLEFYPKLYQAVGSTQKSAPEGWKWEPYNCQEGKGWHLHLAPIRYEVSLSITHEELMEALQLLRPGSDLAVALQEAVI